MNARRLLLLAAFLIAASATSARACKYCMSAENSDAEYQRQVAAAQATAPAAAPGAFPLDSTIAQFQASGSPALATPPPAGSVITNGADLRTARSTAVPAVAFVPAGSKPDVAATAVAPVKASIHYADAGLLGLVAVGGVFCWRTRRKTDSER